jgi:hypothetical protein
LLQRINLLTMPCAEKVRLSHVRYTRMSNCHSIAGLNREFDVI